MDPFVQAAHATDNSHKVLTYFTTRELSNHAHELFAFHALDGEIIKQEPHPGKPGAQWLQEASPYIPCVISRSNFPFARSTWLRTSLQLGRRALPSSTATSIKLSQTTGLPAWQTGMWPVWNGWSRAAPQLSTVCTGTGLDTTA